MPSIFYINRLTKKKEKEEVYGERAINLLYGTSIFSKTLGRFLRFVVKWPFISRFFGYLQSLPASKKKIKPFIKKYSLNSGEFLNNPDTFPSFNAFFSRKLRPSSRPITKGDKLAIIPADGRYLFYSNISKSNGFIVKGKKFSLVSLLNDASLAAHYQEGSLVIGRLCPTDYHRYHFPCNCIPGQTNLLNGFLLSVNSLALLNNINIFTQNKRTICSLNTEHFGRVLFLEVGATFVGSMTQTYQPNKTYNKGEEKGFFSFGGSTVILLFEPNRIMFDEDLLSNEHIEIRCLMGQSMGRAIFSTTLSARH